MKICKIFQVLKYNQQLRTGTDFASTLNYAELCHWRTFTKNDNYYTVKET